MSYRIVRLERERASNPLTGAIELADLDQAPRTKFGRLRIVGMQSELMLCEFGAFPSDLFGILLPA